jgi:hypothetical protein
MICIGLIDLEMNRGCIMLDIPPTQFGIGLDESKGANIFGKGFFYVLHVMLML